MKNLSVAALIGQMMGLTSDTDVLGRLQVMLNAATRAGVSQQNAGTVIKAVAKS